MMGHQPRRASLFYNFRLEDQIPADHLLRRIDAAVDFSFVRDRLHRAYSPIGRPSIDPEVLVRLLLVGYLYGISSERRLMEEVRMHLAYRWFARLDLDQEIPDHSTVSKNRHGRFRASGVFRAVFEEIVRRCLAAGLVDGRHVVVDGTVMQANASAQSRVPAAQYLAVLDQAVAPPTASRDRGEAPAISTTDPDATWLAKRGRAAALAYYDNYLIDAPSRVILDVEATPARFRQESLAARVMVARVEQFGIRPESLGADKAYGSGEFLAWLLARGIRPYVPVIDRRHQTRGRFTQDDFHYAPEENGYYCPQGQLLRYRGLGRQTQCYVYCATPTQCAGCPQKARCTPASARRLSVNWHEPARQRVRALHATPAYARAYRTRYRIETLFGELKEQIRLRRVRLRRLWNVAEQFQLAATAQNLKRLVAYLAQAPPPRQPSTA